MFKACTYLNVNVRINYLSLASSALWSELRTDKSTYGLLEFLVHAQMFLTKQFHESSMILDYKC